MAAVRACGDVLIKEAVHLVRWPLRDMRKFSERFAPGLVVLSGQNAFHEITDNQSLPGMMRLMNSWNSGTVNGMSP